MSNYDLAKWIEEEISKWQSEQFINSEFKNGNISAFRLVLYHLRMADMNLCLTEA